MNGRATRVTDPKGRERSCTDVVRWAVFCVCETGAEPSQGRGESDCERERQRLCGSIVYKVV